MLLVLVVFPSMTTYLPLLASGGGALAFFIVYAIAWKGGTSSVRLVLAGVIVGSIAGSVQTALHLFIRDIGTMQDATAWMAGSLTGAGWTQVRYALPWTVLVVILALCGTRAMDVLLLGDARAKSLGMAVERSRFLLAAVAILAAGTVVSVAGLVGFVGLIVPHIVRSIAGSTSRVVVIGGLATGPALMLTADAVARLAFRPMQLPVGLVTGDHRGRLVFVPDAPKGPAGATMKSSDPQPRLTAHGVRFAYEKAGPIVLGDVSARVPPRKITALIGANGSGKSTLLKLLGRQLVPDGGNVVLDGKDIAALSRSDWAARVGMLFQESVAPQGLSVEELVAYGRFPYRRLFESQTQEDVEAIEAALHRAGLIELRHRPLESLSGGQKQLAWIALALAQTTRILLLDEPTTFLDLKHQAEVMEVIESLRDELALTIVMVLHDVNQAARHADHLIAMRAGAIITEGRPTAVLTADLLREIYEVDAEVLTASDGLPVCVVRGGVRSFCTRFAGNRARRKVNRPREKETRYEGSHAPTVLQRISR